MNDLEFKLKRSCETIEWMEDKEARRVAFTSAYAHETSRLLGNMLLNCKIRLRDIPFHVRTDMYIYTMAFRVSRIKCDTLIEDLTILMSDIERLPGGYCANYMEGTDLKFEMLQHLSATAFNMNEVRGNEKYETFYKNFAEPFLRKHHPFWQEDCFDD